MWRPGLVENVRSRTCAGAKLLKVLSAEIPCTEYVTMLEPGGRI